MGIMTRLRTLALGLAAAAIVGASAHADIKSFNAAMNAGDYKTAAAEAASTWPTLDKSRKDIAIIAREFGFAAYMAQDYATAKMFGVEAVSSSAALDEHPALQASSAVLRDVSAHRLAPSVETRNQLYRTLQARAAQPGLDVITYFASDVITGYDFERGAWKDAQASSALSQQLSEVGGEDYGVYSFRFDLFKNVAEYMDNHDAKIFGQLGVLKEKIISAINASASDEEADPLTRFYWEVHAWHTSIGAHLVSRRKLDFSDISEKKKSYNADDRVMRVLDFRVEDDPCKTVIDMRRKPNYPKSALYKGLIGVVILRVDIDAEGNASNPEVLTAVPDKYFGEAVLRSIKDFRRKPGEPWGPECSLVRPGHVVTFQFIVGG